MYKMNLESTSKKAITLYLRFLSILFKKLKINYSFIHLPTTSKGVALLKSPHVNKKAKEHFELKTYQSLILIKTYPDVETLRYIFFNKPLSVSLNLNFSTNKNPSLTKKIVKAKKMFSFTSDPSVFYKV